MSKFSLSSTFQSTTKLGSSFECMILATLVPKLKLASLLCSQLCAGLEKKKTLPKDRGDENKLPNQVLLPRQEGGIYSGAIVEW
jgi:hypothetical protein